MNTYHLTHKNDLWRLKQEGTDFAIKTFGTKKEAVRGSVDYVKQQQGSLRIHKLDGTFQEERTYPRSADPRTSHG